MSVGKGCESGIVPDSQVRFRLVTNDTGMGMGRLFYRVNSPQNFPCVALATRAGERAGRQACMQLPKLDDGVEYECTCDVPDTPG